MSHFDEYGYEIARNVLDEQTCKLSAIQFEIIRDIQYATNGIDLSDKSAFGDDQVKNSFCWYGAFWSDAIMKYLHPKAEVITGKKLYPTYSYARIYYNGASMKEHLDRESCEYSATITIDIDQTPWEIWFKDLKQQSKPLILGVGDACFYRGTELVHWRNEYKENRQMQVFVHYVDQNGQYAEYALDKRKVAGTASNAV